MPPDFRTLYRQIREINPSMPAMFDDNIRLIYRTILTPGDHAIDCGSHTGKHTFPMAACVESNGKIHAYEPIPEKNEIVKRRIKKDRIYNIDLREKAVGDASASDVTFFYIRNDPGKSSLQFRKSHDPDELDVVELKVDMVTLDEELLGAEIKFIKMDVEGHEYKALNGARKIIETCRPVVCIEHGSNVYRNQVSSALYFQYFDERDYILFDILGHPLRTEDDFLASAAAAGVWDYVMIPKEQKADLQLENMLKGTHVSPSDAAPHKLHRQHHLIGRMFGKLKDWRRSITR